MIREEMQNLPKGCNCSTLRIPSNQNKPSTRLYQLHFNNELPEIIFTGNIVEPKGSAPVQIFITDDYKNKITSGPLSMIKIEIFVLDGDFSDDEQGSWTGEEFNKHVLRERKGKGPLLKGNPFVTLKGGVGNLCSISFTDNSKWTRTHKFRLGARALQDDPAGERIQEAVSEAFCVNDHRGEYTMKHHTPALKDEVWRLKNIRKDGPYHKRLVESEIRTVEDFLKSLAEDQDKLCSILFGKKIANKKWKTIVQHALKCDLSHKCYSYVDPGQQNVVNRLEFAAYDNQNAMAELNDPTNSLSGLPSAVIATYTPETNPTYHHHTNIQINPEVYETGALVVPWDPSVPYYIEDSSHVEGQQRTCFTMEGLSNMDGVLGSNIGGYGTESSGSVSMAKQTSWNSPATHISRSKWFKLRVTIKLGTSIRKSISARRSARLRQIRWLGLLAAVRFGRSIRSRAAATRRERMLNREQSWSHRYSPPPFIYPIWPQEEDSYF